METTRTTFARTGKASGRKANAAQKKSRKGKEQPTIDHLAAPLASSGAPKEMPQPAAAAGTETKVIADIDVGFGNALYIRGDGAGLNWEKGVPLTCLDHRTWVWTNRGVKTEFSFKLLLNDSRWSRGENVVATPGKTVCVCPTFD